MKKLIFIFIVMLANINAECRFPVGEEFKYSVKLNFVKAGKSFIKIEAIEELDGNQVYHIISKTRTTGLWDRMFHIREHMESWTDCDSLFSRKFYKDVDEVNYERTFEVNFDYKNLTARLRKGKIVEIDSLVMDWLSMIYYFRNVELADSQEIKMTFFDNNKFKQYSAIILGQKKVEVKAGKFNCWIIEPGEISSKSLKHNNDLKIYISVEEPRIPVKITSKAKFGTMILELE